VNDLFFKAVPGPFFDERDERIFCRSISNKSMKTPRIIAVHLLNDFSSSPYTFSQALNGLQLQGYEIHLFTATPSGNGFLNEIWGIFTHQLYYRTSANPWLSRAGFLVCQVFLFFQVLAFSRSGDIVYINSMFPFGAAIAGRLKRCKVLYHIQEVSIRPVEEMAAFCHQSYGKPVFICFRIYKTTYKQQGSRNGRAQCVAFVIH
jgi:hypothetical protein